MTSVEFRETVVIDEKPINIYLDVDNNEVVVRGMTALTLKEARAFASVILRAADALEKNISGFYPTTVMVHLTDEDCRDRITELLTNTTLTRDELEAGAKSYTLSTEDGDVWRDIKGYEWLMGVPG